MAEQDLFGYGTGYVPQTEKLIKQAQQHIPDMLLDYFMTLVQKDGKAQGVDLRAEDDDVMDMVMETVSDISYGWLEKVRAAAKSGDEDEFHLMLLHF